MLYCTNISALFVRRRSLSSESDFSFVAGFFADRGILEVSRRPRPPHAAAQAALTHQELELAHLQRRARLVSDEGTCMPRGNADNYAVRYFLVL